MVIKGRFTLLFVGVASVSCWFGGQFFHRLYHYLQLSVEVPARLEQWTIREQPDETFAVELTYAFEWRGEPFQKMSLLSNARYPNVYRAQEALKAWQKTPFNVWLNPKNIQNPSLTKTFPVLEGVKTLLCLGILIYFVYLKCWVSKAALLPTGAFLEKQLKNF